MKVSGACAPARIPTRQSQTMCCHLQFSHSLFLLSEVEMSAQGAVPPVLGEEVRGTPRGGGGQSVPALLLPTQPPVPQAPPGQGRGAGQGVQRPGGQDILGILRLAPVTRTCLPSN